MAINEHILNQAKRTIERTTGLSSDEHNQIIYETGLAWLNTHFKLMPASNEDWQRSDSFWCWWKMQWNIRNYELLLQLGFDLDDKGIITKDHIEVIRETFKEKHGNSIRVYPAKPLVKKIRKETFKTLAK